MTFLPIVDRELRVATRRKSTYRARTWTSFGALLFACVFLLFKTVTGGAFSVGSAMLNVLSGYAFVLCVLAGVGLTADCISEERREGTLGMLLLTDLKGYDVVLGKFMANSLNAFYALMAILPVMSLSLLLGGVTGSQFGRMSLALLNALFFSLAAGMFVSTAARDPHRAMGRTLALMIVLVVALPFWEALCRNLNLSEGWSYIALASPTYCFLNSDSASGHFWLSLLIVNLVAWGFVGAASLILPRNWQSTTESPASGRRWFRWPGGRLTDSPHRTGQHAELRDANPIAWLADAGGVSHWFLWALGIIWVVGAAIVAWFSEDVAFMISIYGGGLFGFILKVLLAFQACRFFAESRRNGLLEVLLCTPVTTRQIINGQWLALRRRFLGPMILFVIGQWIPIVVQAVAQWVKSGPSAALPALFSSAMVGYYGVSAIAGFFAVGWFGMWLALTMRKPAMAPGATILFVIVIPMVAFCVPSLFTSIGFIAWGWTKLVQDLRRVVAEQYQAPVVYAAAPKAGATA